MSPYKHEALTEKIIKSFFKVYNKLGYGFLEKVYENALAYELRQQNLDVTQQVPITVFYDDVEVGRYVADMIVNDLVILEIKSAEKIIKAHQAQLLNYLRSTNVEVGLVLNFGPKPEISRKVYETARRTTNPRQQRKK